MVSPYVVATASSISAVSLYSDAVLNATTHQPKLSKYKYVFTIPEGTKAQQEHCVKICDSLYPKLRSLEHANYEAKNLLPDCVRSIEFGHMSLFQANKPSWKNFTTEATIDYKQMKLFVTIDYPDRHESTYSQVVELQNGLTATCKSTTL